jgi:hypothetical protein
MILCKGGEFDKLYEKVPKSCLPSEFGGELASIAELHERQRNEFARLQSYFIHEEKEASLK